MGEPEKKPPTKAAVIEVEVAFKEIFAIYELYGMRRVIGSPEQPKVVFETLSMFYGSYGNRWDPRYEDDLGNPIYDVKAQDLPGVYQVQRVTGYAPALRTFSRKLSEKIDKKWVYVFVSQDKAGSKMQLGAELAFAGGSFQLVDLKANEGKDTRPASGEKRTKLQAAIRSVGGGTAQLWFLLAPHQIPWAGLAKMVESGPLLASRCQRLFDEFYTDAAESAGGEYKPIFEQLDAIKAQKPLTFLLHLVDPFKEAMRRTHAYVDAVSEWHAALAKLSQDSEYVLAKRIHNLPNKYVDVVWNKLGPYLGKKEEEQRKLLRMATNRLEDLMRWIGESHQRDSFSLRGSASSDTFYFTPGKLGLSNERKEDRTWVNPFSQLVADYNHATTPDETYKKVGEVVVAVHSRLADMPRGQDFLKKIVDADFSKSIPIADGGAKLLFEAGRKGDATAAETVGGLLEFYAPKWVEAYKKDALPQLVKFMRERHKIELKQIKPRAVRRAEEAIARRADKAAAKKGLEALARHYHVELEPGSVQALKIAGPALHRLAMGIEIFNLKLSVAELAESKDVWAGVGLLGSTIDAYSAMTKIYPRLESFSYTIGGVRKAIKIAPVLAVISSTIDTVLAARDAYNSTNFGEQAGHSLRTVGAAMTVGGALAAETGVGVVVAIVGLGLQGIGSWIASEFDDLEQFLRHSRWGSTTKMDAVSDWFSDKNDFGYTGSLDKLAGDIQAQHRALDWMFWKFSPDLGTYNGAQYYVPSRIWLKMGAPKGIGPTAKWSIKLDVVSRDNGYPIANYEWKANDEYDHAILTSNDEIWIAKRENAPRPITSGPVMSAGPWGKVKVKGEIKLDVFGDGAHYVVRRIDENFDLPF